MSQQYIARTEPSGVVFPAVEVSDVVPVQRVTSTTVANTVPIYNDGYDNAFCQWLSGSGVPTDAEQPIFYQTTAVAPIITTVAPPTPAIKKTTKFKAKKGSKDIKCPHCSKEFMKKGSFELHLRNKHDFKTVELLKKHSYDFSKVPLVLGKSQFRILICTKCPEIELVKFADILRHNRVVHNFEENICACGLCDGKVFETYKTLRHHVETQHSEEYKPLQCTKCDFRATKKNDIVKHYLAFHSEDEANFQCLFCELEFGSSEEKETHERDFHPLECQGYCQECKRKMPSKTGLFFHMKTAHKNFTSLGADPCLPLTLQPKAEEIVIANVPAKPGPQTQPLGLKSKPENITITFDCTRCEASFGKRFQLKRHALEAHQETASFSTVDQGYFVQPEEIVIANVVEPDSLQTILVQADLEPLESLQPWNQQQQQRQTKRVLGCPLDPCDFKSPFKSKVKQHARDVHGKRCVKLEDMKVLNVLVDAPKRYAYNYPCSWTKCKEKFVTKQEVIDHVQTVHGQSISMEDIDNLPSFTCEYCNQKFFNVSTKKAHITNAHFAGNPQRNWDVKPPIFEDVLPPSSPQPAVLQEPQEPELKTERRSPSPLPIPSFRCSQCRLSFSYHVSLNLHVLTEHSNQVVKPEPGLEHQLPCGRCGAVFGNQDSLDLHCQSWHRKRTRIKLVVKDLPDWNYDNTVFDEATEEMAEMAEKTSKEASTRAWKKYRRKIQLQMAADDQGREMSNARNPMVYNCLDCNDFPATDKYPVFRRHVLMNHHEKARLQCSICFSLYDDSLALKDHVLERHSDVFMPTRCGYCRLGFRSQVGCQLHKENVHPAENEAEKSDKKTIKCKHCDKEFSRRNNMMSHVRIIHLNKRNYKCEETSCDRAFGTPSKLSHHLKAVHGKEVDLKTLYGVSKSKKLSGLKTRQPSEEIVSFFNSFDSELKRGPDGKLNCVWENCPFTAKHPAKVKLHVETVHLKLRRWKCDLCAKDGVQASEVPSFTTKSHLESHIDSIHKRLRPYVCEICGLSFTRAYNLTTHMKRNKGKCQPGKRLYFAQESNAEAQGFACESCGSKFGKQHLLEAHVKRYQGQCEPGKVMHVKGNSVFAEYIMPDDGRELFKCDQCDRIYPYKQSLTQHIIRVHGNGSMFVCDVCGKSFTQKHRLTVHQASAHGQFKLMPNLCTVCGRRFVTPFSLRRHMAERHNKSLVPQEN